MRLGVFSDTHNDVAAAREALRVFTSFQAEVLVHCGDVGAEVVRLMNGWNAHFVCGNTDDADALRQAAVGLSPRCHGAAGELELAEKKIAFLHGDDVRLLQAMIRSERWDLICCGHTHSAKSGYEGRTLVLNPGALYRSYRPSVAIVDLSDMDVMIIPV